MYLSVTIDGVGTDEFVSVTMNQAVDANDDGDFEDVGDTASNAKSISGLTDFMHGFDITDDDRHVLVFTDQVQATPAVTAVTAITASEHTNLTVDLNDHSITDLGSKSGTTHSGVTFYETGTVNDDTDPDLAFMGTLTCPDGVTCNIQTDADGAVTAITGYQFSGSREVRAEVEAADEMPNMDYLAFGVWLMEDDPETDGDQTEFAAFAGGGQAVAGGTYSAALFGTASYSGKAAGVYTAGSSVDWFEGNASLTANFGETPDEGETDTAAGTISGSITSIVAGGVSMSDHIRLSSAGITDGAFSGNARMGMGVDEDNDDLLEYPYNGSWSGNFYGPATDDDATEDVTEGPANTAPAAVAGTFGVTGTMGEGDAAVTSTYVGAFGARR